MKSLLFQIALNSLVVLGTTCAMCDDLIKLKSRKVWKVRECIATKDGYKVKPCYSGHYCKEKYPGDEYSCQPSLACGSAYLRTLFESPLPLGTVKKLRDPDGFALSLKTEDVLKSKSHKLAQAFGRLEERSSPIFFQMTKRTPSQKKLASISRALKTDRTPVVVSLDRTTSHYKLTHLDSSPPTRANKESQAYADLVDTFFQLLIGCPN